MSLAYAAMHGLRAGARKAPFGVQRRHMGDVPAPGPKLDKAIKQWKAVSVVLCAPVSIMILMALFGPHVEPAHRSGFAHLKIRNKRFPWRDGDSSMFPLDTHGH